MNKDFKTGHEPGVGTYTCKKCGQKVHLDNAGDNLPPCPKCSSTSYKH